MSRLAPWSFGLALLIAAPAAAQPKQKEPEKPKPPAPDEVPALAAEHLKKSDVKSPAVVETPNLVVAAAIPEAAAKTLAGNLQKTVAMAAKGLKLEDADLKGQKFVVYVFADPDQFAQFQRAVLKQRPEPGETVLSDVKRDPPLVAVSPRRGEKTPNYDALVSHELCRALLARKGGNARIPDWMKDGFARAVQMRVNPASAGGDRGAVARMAPRLGKGAKGTPVADKAWTATGKDRDLVAASLADFLTFGPGAEKLGTILSGLVPTGATDTPTFGAALMGADWMLEDLDRAWRDWLAKGSPANK